MSGLHYLNPRLSIEQCREIDALKEASRDKLFAHLKVSVERVEKSCGKTEAMKFEIQMLQVLAMFIV